MAVAEPFEVAIPKTVFDDLRLRIERARWPAQPEGLGWEHGADFGYLGELCTHWATSYNPERLERALNRFANWHAGGLHFIHERAGAGKGSGQAVLLIHGWPGGPHEFCALIPRLTAAGHDVVVPSLPGFGFSDQPVAPLNVAGVAARLRELMVETLGYQRFAVQGGDWGSIIGARIAFDAPTEVAALHVNTPGVLPVPGKLAEPLNAAEQRYATAAMRWRVSEGFHLLAQGAAPDALAPGLNDSPVGLAAWLVDKYRRWSDCDGEIERRFSMDDVCDFLTLYWATETIASSMRLYAAEARRRWRLEGGQRISVPSAVADFPAEILRPPRAWSERVLGDLRRWTEFDRGGHFAAFEEPQLLADDVIDFLAELA